eukprot:4510746-Amphidinium_carterae.1
MSATFYHVNANCGAVITAEKPITDKMYFETAVKNFVRRRGSRAPCDVAEAAGMSASALQHRSGAI